MFRFVLSGLCALSLAGCMQGAAPGAGATANDGMASKLKPGSSENDAFLTFGPESGFERNPQNWDQSCLSYAYGPGDAPRYVHALYENGALVRATEGHGGLCTFDAPDAGMGT
ncbi:hypothetical protein [Tropicibacter oceani]|uniref:Lipoprotein n=1 Tax=Tropicibacter oceani TaxID=3058420 RepID=A0ABY8QLQ5_9RHOB|nr:hypothetical protein [Tropicibacter oceani]WGW05470.1 hypothetical protein QF118_07960 [Tropicibacter oceani]